MRKYVVIYRAVFIENLQYTANIMMGFITYLILSVVFLNLWGYMYDAPGELIAGYTKEQMIWYVMITEMIWFGARSSTVREQVAADIRGAVTVPVTLFAVMVAVVVLLVTQVLPVFDRVFAQLGVRMGAVATGMMNAGAVLAKAGTGLAVVLVILAAAALVVALAPALREKFTGWFRRSFGGRGILGQMAVARFASSMSMAVASGLSMEESVALSAKLCGGAKEIDEKTERCRKEIEEGGSPADALADSGLFSGRDCRLLKLAEQTGSLPDTLEDLAREKAEKYGLTVSFAYEDPFPETFNHHQNVEKVRAAASRFGISKSTVHKDLSERLPAVNRGLYQQVKEILNENKAERHIRGGIATRKKYKGE